MAIFYELQVEFMSRVSSAFPALSCVLVVVVVRFCFPGVHTPDEPSSCYENVWDSLEIAHGGELFPLVSELV